MSRSLLTLTCFAVCLWGNATAIDAREQLARQLLSFAATEIEQPAASSQEQLRAARKPVVGQRQSGGAISRQEHPTTPLPVLQISQVTNAGPKHQKSTILRSSIQQQVEAVVQNNASSAKIHKQYPTKPPVDVTGFLKPRNSSTNFFLKEAQNWSNPLIVINSHKSKVAGVIMEDRNVSALPVVIRHFHHMLPDLPIQLFYAKYNEKFVLGQPTLRSLHESGALTLTPMPLDWTKKEGYMGTNLIRKRPEFWKATLPAEKILLFEADTLVCPGASQRLVDFLKYDYVGAPWRLVRYCPGYKRFGNGGFSLRDRKAMMDITKNNPDDKVWLGIKNSADDVYFCRLMTKDGAQYRFPDMDTAAGFAQYETFSGSPSVGVHKPWKESNRNFYTMAAMEKTCPGVTLLSTMQKKVDSTPNFKDSEELVRQWDAFQESARTPFTDQHQKTLLDLLEISGAMYPHKAKATAKVATAVLQEKKEEQQQEEEEQQQQEEEEREEEKEEEVEDDLKSTGRAQGS